MTRSELLVCLRDERAELQQSLTEAFDAVARQLERSSRPALSLLQGRDDLLRGQLAVTILERSIAKLERELTERPDPAPGGNHTPGYDDDVNATARGQRRGA